MLGVTRDTFDDELASMSGVDDFFSVARTMPLAALMPSDVTPWLTALSAYSGGLLVGWMCNAHCVGQYRSEPACHCHQLVYVAGSITSTNIPGREGGEGE